MCGRAAQTRNAVFSAATALGASNADQKGNPTSTDSSTDNQEPQSKSNEAQSTSQEFTESPLKYEWRDNFNMSPGMDAMIFFKDGDEIRMERKIWGIISRGGTRTSPLESGMSQHFQALMFNARSDTLYSKPTFARLASMKRTCVIALDGFFEWKAPTNKGKKQPYYVKNKDRPYLLMAGLWTSVPTGREDDPQLDTFTIITTEVSKSLNWLHDRQPVCIWDDSLAHEWLESPSEKVLRKLEASQPEDGVFDWHEVTQDMSSTKFRSCDAIKPLPKMKTIKSFFTALSPGQKAKSPSKSNFPKSGIATSATSKMMSSKPKSSNSAKDFFAPKGKRRKDGTAEADTSTPAEKKQAVSKTENKKDFIIYAAARGTLATLMLRLLSFVCTQYTIRVLDPGALGRASVQMELLLTTCLFLSREGFRLAMTRNISEENASVAWLSIPTGTVVIFLAFLFQQYATGQSLNESDSGNDNTDFYVAGILFCFASWIEVLGEPAALHALRRMDVTLKASAEGIATICKTFSTVLFLRYLGSEWSVTSFGLSQIAYAITYTIYLYLRTWGKLAFPRLEGVDGKTCYLVLVFTLQGCFKHFLTEGDRIVLTALSDNYNQGVYAMGSAYGGIAARILFQPIEENCRLLWSRFAEEKGHARLEQSYQVVIKGVLYVGFVFCFLAVNYTEIVLNILAGRKWGHNTEAVNVLSLFCVYTAFLAWNGTSEAFVYALASSGSDVGMLGFAHTFVGIVFAISAPIAIQNSGTVGLVVINCICMFLRSSFSVYYAANYFSKRKNESLSKSIRMLLTGMFPKPIVTASFIASCIITRYSMIVMRSNAVRKGYEVGSKAWFILSLQHIGVGISCAIVTLSLAFSQERKFRQDLVRLRNGKAD